LPIGGKPVVDVFEKEDGTKIANQRGFHAQGLVPIQFVMSHMNWTPPLNVSMAYLVKMNMLSSHARQVMTMEAIRMGAEYIFYVDDDTLIPPLGLYTLYNFMEQNPHAGAVSGVYTTRENPNEPLIYQEHGAGCAWDFEMGPGANPEPIFGAGAGCLLARVSSIKSWMDAHPNVPIWADEKDLPADSGQKSSVMWGHDVRFCRMLNLHGHPVYVDGKILCGHHDIKTNVTYQIPLTAPGFQKTRDRLGNINTPQYWDQVYGQEGADSWRKYPEMFQAIVDNIVPGAKVLELGCGVGILGSKITAELGCEWFGLDISQTAVDMCRARFLSAEKKDLRHLVNPQSVGYDTIIMSEVLEHLERGAGVKLLGTIMRSTAEHIIITTPNDCMGPSEVPEHTALFDFNYLTKMLEEAVGDTEDAPKWAPEIMEAADDHHLICVLKRQTDAINDQPTVESVGSSSKKADS
jgi:2-polyprenyl-3-methyl-5-hydroxy-6-metoxy-1,4-benzoquinol methylase